MADDARGRRPHPSNGAVALVTVGALLGGVLAFLPVGIGVGLAGGRAGAGEVLVGLAASVPGGACAGASVGALLALLFGTTLPPRFSAVFGSAFGWGVAALLLSGGRWGVPSDAAVCGILILGASAGAALGALASVRVKGYGPRLRPAVIAGMALGAGAGVILLGPGMVLSDGGYFARAALWGIQEAIAAAWIAAAARPG